MHYNLLMERLAELYSTVQNDDSLLVRIDNCIATVRDIQTLCPAKSITSELEDMVSIRPWLTDDVCQHLTIHRHTHTHTKNKYI